MDIQELKSIITSQREAFEELFKNESIIDRDLDKTSIKGIIAHPNILAILGVRRCGKSTFSWLLLEGEKFGYINFFDERLISIRAEELDKILQAFYELYDTVDYLVFDEIQKVNGWERFISRIRTSNKIIITGSNSDLLSGSLATFITGRHLDVELLPFGFREYLRASGIVLDKSWAYSARRIAGVKGALENFIKKGGFPEADKFGSRMLQTIYKDIIENDVIGQHKVRDTQSLRELSKYLISNSGKEITASKLMSFTNIKDAHTVAKYIGYISDAYLVFLLERFSYKLKEQFKAPKKVYCIDSGLAGSVSFKLSSDMGRAMENVVFIELLRRKFYTDRYMELYYWKDHRGREVDFLIKDKTKVKALLQVTYASGPTDITDREKESLLAASRELKCNEIMVITWDYQKEEKAGRKLIKYIPLWKWLLENEFGTSPGLKSFKREKKGRFD